MLIDVTPRFKCVLTE